MHIKFNVNHDFVQTLKVIQKTAVYSKRCVLSYALISLSFEGEKFVSTRTKLFKNKFLSMKGFRSD
jgi:hypothetical protein